MASRSTYVVPPTWQVPGSIASEVTSEACKGKPGSQLEASHPAITTPWFGRLQNGATREFPSDRSPPGIAAGSGDASRTTIEGLRHAGRIALELEPSAQGKVVNRGRLKLWTGAVPATTLAEAVEAARHDER
jgi:hypothetical protein